MYMIERILREVAMSKYSKLTEHLVSWDSDDLTVSFEELEKILGFPLPRSAYSYPAWWANQAGEGHSQSSAWQSVGWRTGELDIANERVSFSRRAATPTQKRVPPGSSIGKNGLTIAEAKAGLAAFYGVPPDNVEITIRG
jgi:hypothetical protein